jgi:hypothetical protein
MLNGSGRTKPLATQNLYLFDDTINMVTRTRSFRASRQLVKDVIAAGETHKLVSAR